MNKGIYRKIFKSTDIFSDFFAREDFVKKVLFPVPNYRLSEDQYSALKKTIGFFHLSSMIYEFVFEDGNLIEHDFERESYQDYVKKSNSIMECQLYSDSPAWGIGISHEDHAILGCSPEFYRVFQSFYGKDDKEEFIRRWEMNRRDYGSDIEWLESLRGTLC